MAWSFSGFHCTLYIAELPEMFHLNLSSVYGETVLTCSSWAGHPTPVITLCKHSITSPEHVVFRPDHMNYEPEHGVSGPEHVVSGQSHSFELTDCDYTLSSDTGVYSGSQDYLLTDSRLVLVSSVFSLDSLSDVTEFSCRLHLPGTNVTTVRSQLFNKYPTLYTSLPRISHADTCTETGFLFPVALLFLHYLLNKFTV